jgi:hypothetical protein
MRRNRTCFAIAATLVAGCASSSAVNQQRDPVMVMMNDGSSIRYENDVRVITAPVPGSPTTLWPALNAEYAKLNLPITQRDSSEYALAAQNAAFNGRFGDGPMARIVDCGLTPFGSQRANAYKVWLTVVSQLQPSGSGGVLRTSVSAKAQDPNSSSSAIQCGTTGALEAEIANSLGGNTSN